MKTTWDFLKKIQTAAQGLGGGLLMLLLSAASVQAQAPAWQMAMSVSTASGLNQPVRGMATDASGNVYLVGSFAGTVSFGAISLTSAGSTDAYVAKWNPVLRAFAWAQQMGGSDTDAAIAVAVSGPNVYVVGETDSSNPAFGAIALSGAGGKDGFVTKLTDAGPASAFAWARLVGGADADGLAAVAVQGNAVYVGGSFGSTTLTLDATTLSNPTGGPSARNGVIARLTDAGTAAAFVWARSINGVADELVRALAVAGSVLYVSGYFTSATCTVGNANLTNTGGRDAFVVRYTDTGTAPVQGWVQTVRGPNGEGVNSMAVVGSSVYIAGYMSSAVSVFGAISLPNTNSAGGFNDIYVAKLTDNGPTGAFVWARRAGGSNADNVLGLAAQGTRLYVAGSIGSGPAAFGAATLTNPSTGSNVVLARLDDLGSSGQFVWAQQAGTNGFNSAYAVAAAPTGIVYTGGAVSPPAGFGTFTVTSTIAGTTGFLASLADGPLAVETAQTMSGFSFFPNPARGSITVRLPALGVSGTLVLFDALGRPVRRQTTAPDAGGEGIVFDVMGVPPGVYALRVLAGAYAANRRLMVE